MLLVHSNIYVKFTFIVNHTMLLQQLCPVGYDDL